MNEKIVLEKAAYEVAKKMSVPPFIFQMPINKGRKDFEEAQSSPIKMYPTKILMNSVNTNEHGCIKVYIVIPPHNTPPKNIMFYIHGAGWIFGSFNTHKKLVRELSYRTNSIVVFPEYTRSPEVKFPIAIEQCYSILNQIPNILKHNNIKSPTDSFILAGDGTGGNMAISMVFLAKYKHGPKIHKLLLYYPVTNDNFNTNSYIKFATNYYLYRNGMKWFWYNYEPNRRRRNNILATPLKACLKQLEDFPDTLILNGEADVLIDEGKAFASRLRLAGNSVTQVTFQGMIHDFVMLNSLDNTNACRAAMNISTKWVNRRI